VAQRDARKKGARLRQALYVFAAACILWAIVGYDMTTAASARSRLESSWAASVTTAQKAESTAEADLTAAQQEDVLLTRAFQPAQKFSDVLGVVGSYTPANAC